MIVFYCSRSEICLRKWFGGRLRGMSPSSSSIMMTTNTAEAEAALGTLDNPQQVTTTDCTSPCSTLSPLLSIVPSNSISKFQQPETSCDTIIEEEKNVDNSKINNSNVIEQRFRFIPFCAFYAFSYTINDLHYRF